MMGMAALALASCTNEEVVNIPSSKVIGFDAFVGINTKADNPGADATETDLAALQQSGAGFYVYGGYQTVPNVFAGTQVTYEGGTWGYKPVSYWVENEVYKFNAYAPDMGVTPTFAWGSSTDANDAVLTFTGVKVDGTSANQKDFVIGKSAVQKPTSADTPGQVGITMKHALAMVKVTLKNGFRTGVRLQIENFAINGIKTTGTFTQFASVVDKAGSWTLSGDAESQSTFTHAGFTLTTNSDTYSNEFIVIPQAVVADAITVTFDGILTDADGKPVEVPNGVTDGKPDDGADGADVVKNKKSFTIKIPAISEGWEINSRYNYTSTITGSTFELKEIVFGDPTIDPWGDYSDITVDPEK